MKNLFIRLRSWYTANRKYDGFTTFVWFGLFSIFILAINICKRSDLADWAIWFVWLQSALYNAAIWQRAKHYEKVTRFLIDRLADDAKDLADELADIRGYLIAANRRRKRAEEQLKWYRNTLRKESAERLGFEVKADEYEFYLLIAQCAIVNDAPDRRDKFLAWMKKHPDIEERQAKRQYLTSLYESFFFGDAKADPKETYADLYGSEEFGQQLFADAAQDANACLGASLGIKPEDEQPQS